MADENKKGNVIANTPVIARTKDVVISPKQTKTLTPKLRFAAFEGEWEQKKYGDIFSFYTTNSFSRDNLNYENGKVKNIHYGDIHTKFSMLFNIENELVPFINEEVDLSRIKEENYCQEGDLVIADASEDYNDVGKTIEITNLNNELVLAGLHTFLARPNKHVMQIGFSGYLVQSWKVRKQVMTIAQGTKVLGIATGRLSKIKLDIPNLPEQQKIAAFLTAVDTKLQQLTTKKQLLAQYKKGVMQQLFSQQLRFKDDDGSAFSDWKKVKSPIKIIAGNAYSLKEYQDNGITLIQGLNISPGRLDINSINYIKETDKSTHVILSEGDILLGLNRPITNGELKVCRYNLKNKAYLYQRAGKLLFNKVDIDSDFLYQYLRSTLFLKKITIELVGSDQPYIKSNLFQIIKLVFPSLKEQQKIANYLSAIDTKIENVNTQIESTQQFKKGLLQQLFV